MLQMLTKIVYLIGVVHISLNFFKVLSFLSTIWTKGFGEKIGLVPGQYNIISQFCLRGLLNLKVVVKTA